MRRGKAPLRGTVSACWHQALDLPGSPILPHVVKIIPQRYMFPRSLQSQFDMDDLKSSSEWADRSLAIMEVSDVDQETTEKLGTAYDQHDMVRMGKQQQLRREFEFFSIWGYAVILGCSWEFALM